MKVLKDGKKFQPIVMLLETQEEVDFMHALMGSVGGCGQLRGIANAAYRGLDEHVENRDCRQFFPPNEDSTHQVLEVTKI